MKSCATRFAFEETDRGTNNSENKRGCSYDPESRGGNRVSQKVLFRKGLNQEVAKSLSKMIREKLKKVNVSIQGDRLRVTGKNKDDLQQAIALLRSYEDDIDLPLQFDNYR